MSETAAGEDETGSAPAFAAAVELVEWLGAERYVHLDLPATAERWLAGAPEGLGLAATRSSGVRLAARIGGSSRAEEGREVRLRLDPAGLLLFDRETGARIPADGEETLGKS